MDNREIFSKRLKETRELLNKTQKEFAEHVKSTAATISAYENGTKNPSLDIVVGIAKKCGVSIDWLCGLSEQKTLKSKIKTYADALEAIISITKSPDATFLDMRIEEVDGFLSIYFGDKDMYNALLDLSKIYSLYKTDVIDKEMYDVLTKNLYKKYNKEISNLPF